MKTFATLSTAEEIAHPGFFRKEEKALAKVNRKHSKLAKGTPQRRKHRKVVARVHERITFRRDNFTHQESHHIVDRFGVIVVEDLNVKRMAHNHCLAKSIGDAAWSAFFAQLSCKAEEAGRQFIVTPQGDRKSRPYYGRCGLPSRCVPEPCAGIIPQYTICFIRQQSPERAGDSPAPLSQRALLILH